MEKIKISLAAARVNARMTQDDVARELHVGKATVVHWEKGKAIPSFATLAYLSKLYQIPIDNIHLPEKYT